MKLNDDILNIISKYLLQERLLDWIDINNLNFKFLSLNTKAIKFFTENPDKIDWIYLSYNPNAIELLSQNQDKINWFNLSYNPNIDDIEDNQNYLDYFYLSSNSSIFIYDYQQMKFNNQLMEEELIKELMKPSRFLKKIELYGDEYYNLFDI